MNHAWDAACAKREAARKKAGYTLNEAAKVARVCPRYLRAIERRGRAPYVLALRLAYIYDCRCEIFL